MGDFCRATGRNGRILRGLGSRIAENGRNGEKCVAWMGGFVWNGL